MPARAILNGAWPRKLLPLKTMSPELGGARPIMVFRSVDLPTPFRPRTDSTRPSATSRLMLNSTCAGPYQVLSSVQRSIEVLAQVDLLHPPISAYRVGG